MIDKTSLNIIRELRHDGRASNVQLARKLGVSMSTVAKKIKTMIDNHVIVIKAMPNPNLLGYHSQTVVGLSVDLKQKDHICRQLSENVHVNMVTTCFGRFDILLLIFTPDMDRTYDFIKVDLRRIDGIRSTEAYFILEDKRWIEDMPQRSTEESKPITLDDLDYKIIKELIQDGRPNYSDLATRLGTSKPTVSRRISVLLKEKVIKILAIPDPSKLDYTANAYLLVNADHSRLDHIRDQLIGHPEIHLMMRLVNTYELFLGVYAKNLESLHKFMEKYIWYIDGIQRSETLICGNFFYFNADAAAPRL
jgi:Lrp/AsnC family transcriptional regulator for asnA, asnC and gidA